MESALSPSRIFSFLAPYLKRYWGRFAWGIALGVTFGLLNGAFVGASTLLFTRLLPEQSAQAASTSLPLASVNLEWIAQAKQQMVAWADAWLPKIGRPLDARQILGGLLLLPVLALLRGFIGYLSSYCMAWASQRLVGEIKVDVFKKLNNLSLDFFNNATTADLLNRVNSDTAALLRCLQLGLSDLIKEPITILSVLAALWFIDWQLTLVAIIFLPLLVIPIRKIREKVRSTAAATNDAAIAQDHVLVESLGNMRVAQAFGLTEARTLEFTRNNEEANRLSMKSVQAKEILNPIIETLAALGMGLVILFIFATHRSVGNLMGFVVGLSLFFTPFKKLFGIHLYFLQTEVALQRLRELFALQPTVREAKDAQPVSSFESALKFEHVSFSYGNRDVLRDIDLEIPRGARVGLAGESGSGKSTLVNLLFRFYDPTEGKITLDGADLRRLKIADLRSQMALVSQEVLLFNTTIAENIGFGARNATRAQIEEAARKAYAHHFIQELPHGYDTLVGERGARLSGGQRQRIAIARAFVRDAKLLVLDEATAALDSQAEAEVQEAINRLAENRTVVCVAHRLSTLASMDRIIVLCEGRIVERGGFQELLQRGGVFAAMAKRQAIGT